MLGRGEPLQLETQLGLQIKRTPDNSTVLWLFCSPEDKAFDSTMSVTKHQHCQLPNTNTVSSKHQHCQLPNSSTVSYQTAALSVTKHQHYHLPKTNTVIYQTPTLSVTKQQHCQLPKPNTVSYQTPTLSFTKHQHCQLPNTNTVSYPNRFKCNVLEMTWGCLRNATRYNRESQLVISTTLWINAPPRVCPPRDIRLNTWSV